MMETKTAKPPKAKLLWLKSISSPLIYKHSRGMVWFNAKLTNVVFRI
jgi:hypothetical protein